MCNDIMNPLHSASYTHIYNYLYQYSIQNIKGTKMKKAKNKGGKSGAFFWAHPDR